MYDNKHTLSFHINNNVHKAWKPNIWIVMFATQTRFDIDCDPQ